MNLSRFKILSVLLALSAFLAQTQAQEQFDLKSVKWTKGPGKASMKSIAEIAVPEGFMFTDGAGTRKLMEAMGNLTSGSEIGFLAPTSMVWFVVFRFSDDGYVKDDDKDKLDADKMIKSIKQGTEEANKERKRRGWGTMNVIGWQQPPKYDETTHNLEWAVIGESEGEQVVNYNTRILGRKGVMEVKLIVEPKELAATLPEFKKLLAAYDYKPGERYAEYKQGDKIATYGLAALVTGGAAVVAAKTGLFAAIGVLFKKAWKLVVFGFVALCAFIKRLFGGGPKTNSLQ